ncbi:MAG TPA: dihydrolipoyl dehydrogenase [Alphaproteobacteria bacterium]|nr:dihydrolipoyl dehydrogenase [Alphaproteobacteria bacterium]USO06172.1 MAG: dihydrolipoyl dehydrogenase [Rhodospirillales bacterium]HOO81887.1 dihydrolipoyl dehydrogenase [Alphaproteobacteria bacterium]
MSDKKFDVIVIGGGPGGYVAAIRAAQLKMKVALVEANHLGGICLNWGCIPTKALLRSSEVFHLAQHADEYGLKIKGLEFDLQKIVERSRGVAKQLSGGIGHLLKKNKVTVFDAYSKLEGGGKVALEKDGKKTDTLEGKHIIVATGARARVIPGFEPDGKFVWTYKEALVPDTMPKKLLVIGSGAIGIEFASFFKTLGAEVTVVEMMDRIVPVEDAEISGMLEKALTKQGMKIIKNAKVSKLDKGKTEVTAHIEEQGGKVEKLTFDRVISAVGIVANTEGLGLEKTKVKLDRGHIVTDGYLKTDEPGVYAIGDVTGAPWLAHKASHEGIICVEKIAGVKDVHPMVKSNIPGCTYCHPQVASVGLTEAAAKEQGYKVKVGRFPFMGNGKAIALGEPEGLVKTVFDEKTGELLGAHMIGAEVTEMIQGYVIGKTAELTEAEFMHTVFPHPTLSEMMHESVLDAYGKAIHF